MKNGVKIAKRLFCVIIALCLIIPCLPTFSIPVVANVTQNQSAVADPSTANNYTAMLGTDKDGNRYSGRVWFDKSVYTWLDDESKLPLYSDFDKATADSLGLEIDSNFMVVGSALGSTTSVSTTTSSDASVDVVIILDNSTSMYEESNRTSRLEKVVAEANVLIKGITENKNNRYAIVAYSGEAETLLPLDYYNAKDNVLSITSTNRNYYYTATATPVGSNRATSETFSVSQWGTNVQIGVDMGMKILANASATEGRIPVVILLTDGVANVASTKDWYAPTFANRGNHGDPTNQYVSFATLLTAAYQRSRITENYGISPTVYGIGVDLPATSNANVVMDPANYLKNEGTSVAKNTYALFEAWKAASRTISYNYTANYSTHTWNYEQLPLSYEGTKQDIIDNINYVDKYFPITGADLGDTFESILVEINEKAFVPLTDTVTQGDVEVDVPLTYVDFIGDYMEIKEFKAVTLFGKIYPVTAEASGGTFTDTVDEETGVITRTRTRNYVVGTPSDIITNEIIGTTFKVSEAINVIVKDVYTVALDEDGNYYRTSVSKQELRVTAIPEALPLIYDKISNNDGVITYTSNRDEVVPLRIYYTVDLSVDVVDTNGNVITAKIDDAYLAANTNDDGTINFYSNRYGVMNKEDAQGNLYYGDSHATATPAHDNRYYYYQSNYPVYVSATDKDGKPIKWEEGECGVLYYQGDGFDTTTKEDYLTSYMHYTDVLTLKDDDEVYIMVAFYRPTSGTEGEAVGYLVYTDWGLLKTDIAFYDDVNKVYINGYDSATDTFITSAEEGFAVDVSVVEAYLNANSSVDASDILCALAKDSWRISRLANMTVSKTENVTGTAQYSVAPTYNTDTHYDGDLVSWLGNNGKMAVAPQQGIEITKKVTETVASAETAFVFTVTVEGTSLSPVFMDKNGTVVNGIAADIDTAKDVTNYTVTLSDNNTIYITGLPTGAEYSVTEADSVYYTPTYVNGTGKVENNTVIDVTVTNSPKQHGDLIISKEVIHPFGGSLDNEFDFTVTLSGITALDASAIILPASATISYNNGTATVSGITVKDGGSVTLANIPANTLYAVTEATEKGFTLNTEKTTGASGVIVADTAVNALFVNDYSPNPPVGATITVNGTKTLQSNANITESFTFMVQRFDEATGEYVNVNGATATIEMTSTMAGAIEAYEITLNDVYTTVGTYYYRVIEVKGNNTHMVYDSTEGLFKVTVTDPDLIDGVLVATVESVANTYVNPSANGFTVDMDFVNIYNAVGTYAEIPVKKTLENQTGVSLPLNLFSFVLTDEYGNAVTLSSDAHGDATFRVPVDTTGTFTYTLTEKKGDILGMTYSEKVYTVTVVAENDNGSIVADVTISDGEKEYNTAEFTNTYTLTSVTGLTLNGVKTLENKLLTDGQFSFVISEADELYGVVENGWSSTVSNKGNDFVFTLPEYTKAGTYRYVITEVIPASAVNNVYKGITYDPAVYHFTVVVSLDDTDASKLSAKTYLTKLGSGNADTLGFTNLYTVKGSKDVVITGNKTLTGRELKGSEFLFGIYDAVSGEELAVTSNLSTGVIEFAPFTYTSADIGKTFEYTVKEKLPASAVNNAYNGVTYDTSEYTVTVTVSDDGEGNLVVTVDGNSGIAFANTYSASPAYVTLSGVKTLLGLDLQANEFVFALKNASGDIILAALNDENGVFTFDPIKFSSAGKYVYTVSEINDGKGGVTYDETVHTVTVTVTDNGLGQLVASTVISGTGSIEFTNRYTAENAVASLGGTKVLEGRDLIEGEFTFRLYSAIVTDNVFTKNGDPIYTVTNKADGSFQFPDGSFSSVGTYYYVVDEEPGALGGITYDDTVYNVTVTVTDNGIGQLKAVVSIDKNGEIIFNNSYSASSAEVVIDGTKILNGREMTDGEFNFRLTNSSGTVIREAFNVDGKFEFAPITYTVAGTYVYTVSEVNDGKGGVTYDDTLYTVTVTVTDNGLGQLVASVTGNEGISFTNGYSASSTEVVIDGTKVLDGRELTDGEFTFLLKDETGKTLQQVTNTADSFKFDSLEFTSAGEYVYTVTEEKGDKGGVTYDDTVYTVTVTVTDNGLGQLVASVTDADNILFTNGYKASSAEVVIDGEKTLNGREMSDGEFTFVLKDVSGDVIEEVTNLDGKFTFSPITFTTAGEYVYTVSEVNDGKGGVTYDDTVYTVIVTVTDNGLGQLVTSVDGVGGIQFTNGYTASLDTVVLEGNKVLNGRDLLLGEFTFRLKDSEGNVIQTVSNGTDGIFAFEKLEFTSAGEYVYTVTEVKGDKGGVTYDETVYTVTITVTDNGKGELEAAVAVSGDGALTFTNTYTAKSTAVTLDGTKNLVGKELEAEMFSFILKDKGGNVLQTVKNNAEGLFEFASIEFDKAGTYTFTVTELIGDEEGMSYDETLYTVTVVVEDDGAGQLVATATVSGDGAIVFNNEYEVGTPELGDADNMYLWCAAMLVSVIGMAALLIRKRRAA